MSNITVSLQAPIAPNPEKNSLQYLISRINEQKGSFRDVTEESLEEEIRNGQATDVALEDDDHMDTGEEVEDAKTKKERVREAREEMLKSIGQANLCDRPHTGMLTLCSQATYESAMALDFTSLLLSLRTPGPAGLTMSSTLKENIPMGSLGSEVVQSQKKSSAEEEQDRMLLMGWRMQSLNTAADSLLQSATRLEGEIGKETRYWNQILAVKERGWPMSRLPREKHTLGVHYGFAEARASFRDKGVGALRRDEDGDVSLDRGPKAVNGRLRVRILQGGSPISTVYSRPLPDRSSDSLEGEILEARNSIYDEELVHEIQREAQYLANHGVQCIDNRVFLPYESNQQIELSLESSDEASEQMERSSHDDIPELISIFLRLSLSQAHLQNLHDRSKPPSAIREGKQPHKIYQLLAPIVQILQHRASMSALQYLLHQVTGYMAKAGLLFSSEMEPFSPKLESSGSLSNDSPPARVQAVLGLISAFTSSTIHITLPGQSAPLRLRIFTSIAAPNFGTSYYIHHPSAPGSKESVSSLPSLADFKIELGSLLQRAIKHHITRSIHTWQNAENGVDVILRANPETKAKDKLAVSADLNHFRVDWQRSGNLLESRAMTWVWYADHGPLQQETRPLHEVLSDLPSSAYQASR
ncbi:MAG: RNA polymerase II mediator complex subunit [Ramalina farinacea]|uniref:Mediator of RNA polymerase II transcription subunit 17 n=1 Tax=Ramalina farinacea TaxID=258253 RepID=A0AA43QGJ6_9LECA|nr:RNA polymerase II mediator complex subunit [Ramalina farinacea]